mmetsp:Transcript_107523/g.342898  ORF Transcript_107523/g.342898 Transcript_107523/m.342898 type:complete len:309 (+) Transcript_107523:1383-2309(+)
MELQAPWKAGALPKNILLPPLLLLTLLMMLPAPPRSLPAYRTPGPTPTKTALPERQGCRGGDVSSEGSSGTPTVKGSGVVAPQLLAARPGAAACPRALRAAFGLSPAPDLIGPLEPDPARCCAEYEDDFTPAVEDDDCEAPEVGPPILPPCALPTLRVPEPDRSPLPSPREDGVLERLTGLLGEWDCRCGSAVPPAFRAIRGPCAFAPVPSDTTTLPPPLATSKLWLLECPTARVRPGFESCDCCLKYSICRLDSSSKRRVFVIASDHTMSVPRSAAGAPPCDPLASKTSIACGATVHLRAGRSEIET